MHRLLDVHPMHGVICASRDEKEESEDGEEVDHGGFAAQEGLHGEFGVRFLPPVFTGL